MKNLELYSREDLIKRVGLLTELCEALKDQINKQDRLIEMQQVVIDTLGDIKEPDEVLRALS